MDYSPPTKEELREALIRRFSKNKDNNIYYDAWGCTFNENIRNLIRSPIDAYIPGENELDIRRTNFINRVKKEFPNKFIHNKDNTLKVFSSCYLTDDEMNKLCDLMYNLYQEGVAEFSSWTRVCNNSKITNLS